MAKSNCEGKDGGKEGPKGGKSKGKGKGDGGKGNGNNNVQCHRCGGYGHIRAQCPSAAMDIGEVADGSQGTDELERENFDFSQEGMNHGGDEEQTGQ